MKDGRLQTFSLFILVIVFVTGTSFVSSRLWGTKAEKIETVTSLVIKNEMTLKEFGSLNRIPETILNQIFKPGADAGLDSKVSSFGNDEEVSAMVKKKMALISEEGSKNWIKIPVKFVSWFAFLLFVFIFLKRRKLSEPWRKVLHIAAIIVFGVILGSDPGPMGTVKDAIVLYGKAGTLFPPRMIALTVFLVMVIIANKYICAWGCQAGVLQDFIFRLNQSDKLRPVFWRQFKLPFVFTNSVRVVFFIMIIACALVWGYDIVEPIDLFKVYNPVHLGMAGGISAAVVLGAGLFVYRPWCHLLCPFGLVGWIVKKLSIVKINVDYSTCIGCKKCAAACPSTVMSTILLRDKKVIPDCFSCYTCRDVCPTGSIRFSADKRIMPPENHFKNKK